MIRAILLALCLTPASLAQTAIPRTPEDRPDFQGVWESRWSTPFERPAELDGPTMTAEQAAKYQADEDKKNEKDGDISPPDDSEYGPFMPAAGGLHIAAHRGNVEPLVRLDQIRLDLTPASIVHRHLKEIEFRFTHPERFALSHCLNPC